jgi:hypothetical protein
MIMNNHNHNPNNHNLHIVQNQRRQDDVPVHEYDDYTPPQRNFQRQPARRSAGMDTLTVFLLLALVFLVSLFFLSPYLGGPQ